MPFFARYNNTDAVATKLVRQLGVNLTSRDIVDELQKHPDYPSLLAISDVLSWFKIDNAAYKVSADDLAEIPTPFIAQTRVNDDFIIVSKINGDQAILSDHKQNNYITSLEDLKKVFKNIVLTANVLPTGEAIIDEPWPDKLASYKTPAAIVMLGISLLLTGAYFSPLFLIFNWQNLLLALIITAGLAVSVLLLMQSIDKNNPWLQSLCSIGSKSNCNAILTSKSAVIFKGLSWSEVGFFYFSGSWLCLFTAANNTAVLQALALINIISLPYTFYSIYYQARVAKQWCILCCTVQALLWAEFIVLAPYLNVHAGLLVPVLPLLSICLILPVAIWMLLKPLLLKTQRHEVLETHLRKFKYNRDLFDTSLKSQPKLAQPDDEWSIVLGNVEANTIITVVSNAYCQPCSKTHRELSEWLNRLDDLQLRVIFTTNSNEKDKGAKIARHLMALNAQQDKVLIKNALHDWYEQKYKNYEEWACAYPVTIEQTTKLNVLEKQRTWCKMAEITATPTLLVNGYRLPEIYHLQDIKYMLS